jgi:phytoene dehydrogenase-like protein
MSADHCAGEHHHRAARLSRDEAVIRNGYKFDTGPTFLMMKFILDEAFEEAGRHIGDY